MTVLEPDEQCHVVQLTRGYLGSLPHLRAAPDRLAFMERLLLEAQQRFAAPLVFTMPSTGVVVIGRQGHALLERSCPLAGAPLAHAVLSARRVQVESFFSSANAGRNALARFGSWLVDQGQEGQDLAAIVTSISVSKDGVARRPSHGHVLTA